MNGLVSGLALHIESLLALKHALGLPYTNSERHLRVFDAMCARHYPEQSALTRAMAMAWAAARPGEHVNGQMRRITPVRQLAKHMAMFGVRRMSSRRNPGHAGPLLPAHLHPVELRAIFDAADQIRASPYGGRRQLIIPAIFRMIYCLGLRPGEARRLRRADVDLAGSAVYIRESKGHKDRRVFLSADLHEYLPPLRHRDRRACIPDRYVFFPNRPGDSYSASTINCWFRELLDAAGVARWPRRLSPAYDLRHAHVVETINRCARAGHDPEALIAYLSLHLGHANIADTWYYFHLAADFHPDLRGLANTEIEPMLPEARHGIR